MEHPHQERPHTIVATAARIQCCPANDKKETMPPPLVSFKEAATIIGMLSGMPWQAFGAGTEGGKAQPNIWTDGAKFKSASEKMQAAVADLNSAAQSGNPENLKKALGAASQTCKACHDDFRKK